MQTLKMLTLLLIVASPTYAQGITMVQRETRNGQSATNRMQMDRTHVRAEARSGTEQVAFVYDGGADVARMINIDKKTYTEMTRAQAQQMGQQVSGAMAQMQAQLANLPPEQRAMVEKMMAGRGGAMPGMPGGAPPARVEYRRGGSDKVGQWACTKYEGFRGAEKVVEVCAADPSALGLTAKDFEVTRKLAEFFKGMMPQAADQLSVLGTAEDQGFSGFPVKRTSFRGGTAESVSELTELKREALPAATFEVPSGFRKEAMPAIRE